MHLNAIDIVPCSEIWRVRGIRRPAAGCHDGDAHNWYLAWHGIINEVLVACELVRAALCRSMFIKNTREFSASLFYIFIFYLISVAKK